MPGKGSLKLHLRTLSQANFQFGLESKTLFNQARNMTGTRRTSEEEKGLEERRWWIPKVPQAQINLQNMNSKTPEIDFTNHQAFWTKTIRNYPISLHIRNTFYILITITKYKWCWGWVTSLLSVFPPNPNIVMKENLGYNLRISKSKQSRMAIWLEDGLKTCYSNCTDQQKLGAH